VDRLTIMNAWVGSGDGFLLFPCLVVGGWA